MKETIKGWLLVEITILVVLPTVTLILVGPDNAGLLLSVDNSPRGQENYFY